jgi:hypothetical protein
LVVLWRGYQEKDGCYWIKALKPFLSLRTLASNVHEAEWDGVDIHNKLGYAFSCFTCMKNILIIRQVILQKKIPIEVMTKECSAWQLIDSVYTFMAIRSRFSKKYLTESLCKNKEWDNIWNIASMINLGFRWCLKKTFMITQL